jgi:hypothetical protein
MRGACPRAPPPPLAKSQTHPLTCRLPPPLNFCSARRCVVLVSRAGVVAARSPAPICSHHAERTVACGLLMYAPIFQKSGVCNSPEHRGVWRSEIALLL